MAKIDWSKHRFAHKERSEFETITHEREARNRVKVWTDTGRIGFGKHKGKKIKELTTNYLIWLTKNIKVNIYTQATIHQAFDELKTRNKNSRHKVGGPVSNTAVKKVTRNHTRNISSESPKAVG